MEAGIRGHDAGFFFVLAKELMQYADPRSLADQAWSLAQGRRYREANDLFAKLCELKPDDPEAWMMLGATEVELGGGGCRDPSPEPGACARPDLCGSMSAPG